MIVLLSVENVAIIERAQLRLGPGFTVLTGETGAGKSLLIDAIELVLGERADSDLVRAGAARAVVSAVFDFSADPALLRLATEEGLSLEDGLLYVQREVSAEGRSSCRVGGKLTPVSALKRLGQRVVDLHGQHDHQSLLHPDRHGEFLDGWIGDPIPQQRAAVAEAYYAWAEAKQNFNALQRGLREREQRIDMLRFQVEEIRQADVRIGECEETSALLQRLQHSEKLAESVFGALTGLADQERCAMDLAGDALRNLEAVQRYDPDMEDFVEQVRSAWVGLDEAVRSLRAYADRLEVEPNKIEEVAERLDLLKRLRRKYGEDEAAILDFYAEAERELGLLTDHEQSLERLEAEVAATERKARAAASALTQTRRERSGEFAERVAEQLHDLAMEKARFEVRIGERPLDADGADAIEFYFSANPGEPARPLAKIASGGEVSRVMLAIKTALAGRAGVPTLIFDEVDAGLSGRAAAVVARKLEALAEHYQVLAISHLPQIASRATTHFRIEKQERDGRVLTIVRGLDGDERVEEIARMLAGEALSESALANARDLLGREPVS